MSEKNAVYPDQVESQQMYEAKETQARRDLRPTIIVTNVLCCLCCLIFLLLFFLLPRYPVGYLESTTVYLTDPIKVVQTYEVWNPSFYPISLNNFKSIDLKSDLIIASTPNGTLTYQFTAQGELYNANHVHIPLRQSRHFSLSYLANSTALDLIALTDQCYSPDGISFYTDGHFDFTTSLSPGYTYQAKIDFSTNYVC